MKFINIIAEGSSEEAFVNDVLVHHFAFMNKFVSVRKIETGWDRLNKKPAKGGFGRIPKYIKFRNDVLNWIQSDKGKPDTWYTTFVDLYAFPKDSHSPYTLQLQAMEDPYQKIMALEAAIAQDINHPYFIPYVQLHEFEALLMVEPDRLLGMYPDSGTGVARLKRDIQSMKPEEINESPNSAPSKRIIQHLPDYEGQKAQVGPLVAADIGLHLLRQHCPHFNAWITALENL